MNSNQGRQKIQAIELTRPNPMVAAAISKLVQPREKPFASTGDAKNIANLDNGRMAEIADTVHGRITDAENIMQLFPDLALAAQIMESSILSPKDMLSPVLNYSSDAENLSTELTAQLTKTISKHMDTFYSLSKMLSDVVHDIMFVSGSYMSIVIPENSLDALINSGRNISTEDLSAASLLTRDKSNLVGLGILGSGEERAADSRSATAALESIMNAASSPVASSPILGMENLVEVTDNYNFLKFPKVIKANNKNKLKSIIRKQASLEAINLAESSVGELSTSLYKGANMAAKPYVEIKTQDMLGRRSIGRPLFMHVPSESVIPVHVPGDEKKQIGYFILVDMEGNPLTKSANSRYLSDLMHRPVNATDGLQSTLIARAKQNLMTSDTKNVTIDYLTAIYSELIETDLLRRLKNGVYGTKVAIGKDTDVYRMMYARTLANQYTRLVYIPEELATYFAFQYFKNGTGKSMLDDLKVLTSLRAILLFSKVMAMTKNAISLTHVNMTLDPNDPDPQETIEMSIHEIVKMRQQYFPLGINQPIDLVDWIQRAGLEFSFEGHPGIPNTKFDFETRNIQHQLPDTDLDESLRKQTFMAVGLNPETVDAGFGSDFAASVVTNNALRSRRILQYQERLSEQITDHVRKIIHADQALKDEMIAILTENKDILIKYLDDDAKQELEANATSAIEMILDEFIAGVNVTLPKPDAATIESQNEAFSNYSDALEKALDSWVSSSIMDSSIAGDISSNMDAIKAALKAYYQREWMAKNGYMLELSDITTADKEGNPNLDVMNITKEHTEGVIRAVTNFLKHMEEMRNAATTDLNNMAVPESDAPAPEPSSEDDGLGGGGGDGLGDLGMGDLDLGGEGGSGEEPLPDEETPPEPTEGTENANASEPAQPPEE